MSEPEEVVCGRHGKTPLAWVCRHLKDGFGCGVHVSTEDPDDRWPDAWCDLCNRADEVTDINILCTHCYEAACDRNRRVPDVTDPVHRMHVAQDEANARWHFNDMAKWFYDSDANTLSFTDPVHPTVIADVRPVGSYSTRTGTFQWAWQTLAGGKMQPLRTFGEVHKIERLTTPNFACEEADAWEMTSIAALVLGAEAMYRPPFDHLYWFMLLSNLRHPS